MFMLSFSVRLVFLSREVDDFREYVGLITFFRLIPLLKASYV